MYGLSWCMLWKLLLSILDTICSWGSHICFDVVFCLWLNTNTGSLLKNFNIWNMKYQQKFKLTDKTPCQSQDERITGGDKTPCQFPTLLTSIENVTPVWQDTLPRLLPCFRRVQLDFQIHVYHSNRQLTSQVKNTSSLWLTRHLAKLQTIKQISNVKLAHAEIHIGALLAPTRHLAVTVSNAIAPGV